MSRVTFVGSLITAVVAGVVYALGLWLILSLDATGWPIFALRLALMLIAVVLGLLAGNAYRRAQDEKPLERPEEKSHG